MRPRLHLGGHTLVLTSAPALQVSIANWKREHIDEYLAEKLASA